MRVGVGKLGFSVLVAGLVLASCHTSGMRYVIMSLSTDGTDPRSVFFVDSKQINCVAKVSVGDPDTYIEARLIQHASVHWDDTSTTNQFPLSPPDHPLFAATEIKPGVGSEENASFTLNSTGTGATVQCSGYCTVDPPVGVNPCLAGYTFQGLDSCGFGAACCFNAFASQNQQQQQQSVLPYPAGTYECDIYINGDFQGSVPFAIEYACAPSEQVSGEGPGPCCPTLPPTAGVPCRFWVPKGTVCDGYAANSVKCTCNTYYWECQ